MCIIYVCIYMSCVCIYMNYLMSFLSRDPSCLTIGYSRAGGALASLSPKSM